MGEGVNICIAIAVSQPERLKPLPGTLTAAKGILQWADALNYRTCLIADENKPVTRARLKSEIEGLVAKPNEDRGRIIVSFAGHGFISGTRDLWLLNNWYKEPDEIVDVELMRRRLGTYLPRQITIISDACRSPPPAADPTLQGSSVLSRFSEDPPEPDFDILLATGIGKPAYMVKAKGDQRAYCMFSQVVTNALWGEYENAVDQTRAEGPAVTSQTLKTVVRRELPLAAKLLDGKQSANIETNFTPPDDVYTPISFLAKKPGKPELEPAPRLESKGIQAPSSEKDVRSDVLQQFAKEAPLRPTHFETGTGLAVVGGKIKDVAVAPGAVAHADPSPQAPPDSYGRWYALHGPPTSLAVQLEESRLWAGGALFPQLIGTFTVRQNGVSSVVYRRSGQSYTDGPTAAEQGIAALYSGNLRDDEAIDLATTLRMSKHSDPVGGIIAAYLYARVADLDSIRRVAWFYQDMHQPIPFDIALLGRVKLRRDGSLLHATVPATKKRAPRTRAEELHEWTTRATSAAEMQIAGGFPWLHQGWSLIDDWPEPSLNPIREFEHAITPALFTTFNADAGPAIAKLIREGKV